MAYDFSELKQKVADAEAWLKREYQGIRTGRAAPALLDNIVVEAYGAKVPLNQVGSVSVEDARTLRISVWDPSQVKAVEKAITDASLGVSVSSDETSVRVAFPELTSERREQLIKLARDKLEQARVTLRGERDEVWNDIQTQAKNGDISEDDKFRLKDEMQKIVDDGNKALEALAEKKEAEVQA